MSRVEQILDLLIAGKTITEVAKVFGVSKQRIHQILVESGNRGVIKAIRQKAKKPKLMSVCRFRKKVNEWLSVIGYRYCTYGHHAVEIEMFSASNFERGLCRKCNTDYAKKSYHVSGSARAAYMKKYNQSEKFKKYIHGYYQKNKERCTEYQRNRRKRLKGLL